MENENGETAETRALSRATFGAMAGVVLSRLSGLIREQILSIVFGAGVATDAFYVAFRYPNALRDLLADGALSSAFTKTLVAARAEGIDVERKLISVVLAFFGLVTLVLALAGLYFAEPIMALTTSQKFVDKGGLPTATLLFRILAFYLPVTMFSASAMAVLGVHRQTFRATFASSFFNVGTIAGALILSPLFSWAGHEPLLGLAVGALVGGVLQFGAQAIPLYRMKLLPVPKISWREALGFKPLHEILALMGPRALSQGAMVLALFINTLLATSGNGTVTYISKAQVIILVPVGLFGVASGFASLPMLTEAAHEKGGERFSRLLGQSLFGATWFSFFTIIGFALAALPFTGVLLQHGHFTRADTMATATAICAYAVGILFNSGSKVLQQGFFALGHTRQVVVNSLVYLAVNATASWYFSRFDSGPVPFGLSNSLAAAADFCLNLFFLERISRHRGFSFLRFGSLHGFSLARIATLATVAVAAAIAGVFVALRADTALLATLGVVPSLWSDLIWLMVAGGFGAPLFLVSTWFWGPEHLKRILEKVVRRGRQRSVP